MRNFARLFAALVLLAACGLAFGSPANAEETKATQVKIQERQVKLDELPAPVKATILKEAGDHKLNEIEEVRAGKNVFYEAEWIEEGLEVEIRVAPDGKLLGRVTEEPDDEAEDDDDEDDEEDDD